MGRANDEPVLFEAYLDLLWHSLGMTSGNYRRSLAWWRDDDNHRNHFCANVPDERYDDLLESMVSKGWMARGRHINAGTCRYYHATEEGIRVARDNFPRPVRTKRKEA